MRFLTWKNILITIALCATIIAVAFFASEFHWKFNSLDFTSEYVEKNDIKINNEPAYQFVDDGKNINIYPLTMNVIYPNEIKVGSQVKKIRISSLDKKKYIPILIKHKNGSIKKYHLYTLPMDFPSYNTTKKYPKGYVLTSTHGTLNQLPSQAAIFKTTGKLMWYRKNNIPTFSAFHLQQHKKDNKIRYSMHVQTENIYDPYVYGKHLLMNEHFKVIDEIQILKTEKHKVLPAEEHDFIYIDDGHYIVFSYITKNIFIPLYNKTLACIVPIIQEQKDKKVLFEWHLDNYPEFFKAGFRENTDNPDYIHLNSISISPQDNNLIISSAKGNYIAKLHRTTGELMWILGGNSDQFKLTKEQKFTGQHHVQVLNNNNVLMFDNGYFRCDNDQQLYNSRAIEFAIDEKTKNIISTKIINFNEAIPFMGSVQKLGNNTFVGCGQPNNCVARMINSNNKKLYELTFEEPYFSYRSYWVDSIK